MPGNGRHGLVYPDVFPSYEGQEVNLIPAVPDIPNGKKYVLGVLWKKQTKRGQFYYVGNRAICQGDSVHSKDLQTFLGWIRLPD